MESAIDSHLQCPRTRTRRVGDDYTPPYPAYSARAPKSMSRVVMGYFGVPSRGDDGGRGAAFAAMSALFDLPDGPQHRDVVHYADASGYGTDMAIAYWGDPAVFQRWRDSAAVADWWGAEERLAEGVGYFRELLAPRDEQFETAFSSARHPEGIGVVMGGMSGEIAEHGYWGSMRDRIPLSQTDTRRTSISSTSIATPKPA